MAKINAFGVITGSSWTKTVGPLFPITASFGESQFAPRELWNYLSPYHIHLRKWTKISYPNLLFTLILQSMLPESELYLWKGSFTHGANSHHTHQYSWNMSTLSSQTHTNKNLWAHNQMHSPKSGPCFVQARYKNQDSYTYTRLHACLCMKQGPWVPTHHMIEANRPGPTKKLHAYRKGFTGEMHVSGSKEERAGGEDLAEGWNTLLKKTRLTVPENHGAQHVVAKFYYAHTISLTSLCFCHSRSISPFFWKEN